MGKSSRMKKERREMAKGLDLWHYTTNAHIREIFDSGALKPTAIRIDEGERPALWLSTNSDWERTVTKRLRLSTGDATPALQRDELANAGIIPVRIKVDATSVKVLDWIKFKKVSGIRLRTAKRLETTAKENGANPSEWYATFESIPLDNWISLDFWVNGKWVSHNLEEYYSMKQHELLQEIEQAHEGRNQSNG